jgi:hypothetical protein
LKESDAELMNSKWPQGFSDSEEYLRTCIKFNPSTGLYRSSDNKLIGWSIVLETGAGGNLYIDDEYRRLNIGRFLTMAHGIRTLKAGKLSAWCGFILHYNDISFKMQSVMSHFLWVNNVSSIGVKKRKFDGLAPLWGHL